MSMGLSAAEMSRKLAAMNARNREFWRRENKKRDTRIAKHPDHLHEALHRMHGAGRAAFSLEHYLEEIAPFNDKRAFLGGFGKGDAYAVTHKFTFAVYHQAWVEDPTQYDSMSDFCEHTSGRLKKVFGQVVAPSTIKSWLTLAGCLSPRKSRKL